LPFLIAVTIGTVLFLLAGHGGFMAEGIIPEDHGTIVPVQNLNNSLQSLEAPCPKQEYLVGML
jgi:hypothetical protein